MGASPPPRAPPRHLFHHHSVTVCLHYHRSWMNPGWGLSLGSSGGPSPPAPPPLPPTLCPQAPLHQQPHPNTHKHSTLFQRLNPEERVLLLPASYLLQIWRSSEAGSVRHRGTVNSWQALCTRTTSAAADLFKLWGGVPINVYKTPNPFFPDRWRPHRS